MSTAVTANVINVTVDGTQLDLVEEDSVDYDGGESTNDFEAAAKEISETFHEVANPTLSLSLAVEKAAQEGLTACGFLDETGEYQLSGNRRIEDITLEYLNGENGEVELEMTIPSATAEWNSLDSQNPLMFEVTMHVNEKPTVAVPGAE